MSRASARVSSGGRSVLLLWTFIVILGLVPTVMAGSVFGEVAASALFGSPGTQLALAGVLVAVIFGAGVAMNSRGASLPVCRSTVLLLSVAVAVTTVLAIGFFADGAYQIVGLLLVQSAIFIALIAGRVYRSTKALSRDRRNG
jgi:hypothetical protein